MVRLYCIGLSILIIAILANILIGKLGLLSWYDFLNLLKVNGTSALKGIGFIDYAWLFIGYPIVLGLGYRLGDLAYSSCFN